MKFISTGYGALPQWLVSFDCSVLPRSLLSVQVAVKEYSRTMVRQQQVFLKTINLSAKPTKNFPPDPSHKSKVLPLPIPLPIPTTSVASTSVSKLMPCRRKIACVFGRGNDLGNVIIKKETPDIICHKRAFSHSVIRIPYLTLDRLSAHQPTPKSSTLKKTVNVRSKLPKKRKATDFSGISLLNMPSGSAIKIKLEPPEIFVSTPTGYQFVSRPEFSEDDSDPPVIVISSEDSA